MPLVQSSFAQGSVSASETGTFATAPVLGNLIIAFPFIFQAGAGTLNSVTDTQGNTYTPIRGLVQNSSCQEWLYYCPSAKGGGSNIQITATWNASVSFPTIGWAEFSGFSALDASGQATGSTTTASASCTTTTAGDLIIGWLGDNGGGAATPTDTVLFNAGNQFAQYRVAASAGAQSSSMTAVNSAWVTIVAAFKSTVSVVKPNPFPWALFETEAPGGAFRPR